MAPRSGGGTPATAALDRAGTSYSLHAYEHDPAASRSLRRAPGARLEGYGLEAAERLGLDPGAVFKTLLADVDGRLVVGIVPVTHQLDLKALAAAVGGKRASMAEASAAERATGYVVGGISPLGQKKQLPTVLDASALDLATVYVSAGKRGHDLGLAPTDLASLTGATVAAIARTTSR